MMPPIRKLSLEDKEQADGAQTLAVGGNCYDSARLHQIQVELSATPATGVLTIGLKTPGASGYATLTHQIDLVNGPYLYQIYGFIESLQFTPVGFDAGKTYSVFILSGDTE